MKVKKIALDLKAELEPKGFTVLEEYTTPDKTRLDVAVMRGEEKLVALEFEKTYKWIQHRVLYNSIKAYRAGFGVIVFVYPFNKDSVINSWVMDFIQDTLRMKISIVSPDECLSEVAGVLRQKGAAIL